MCGFLTEGKRQVRNFGEVENWDNSSRHRWIHLQIIITEQAQKEIGCWIMLKWIEHKKKPEMWGRGRGTYHSFDSSRDYHSPQNLDRQACKQISQLEHTEKCLPIWEHRRPEAVSPIRTEWIVAFIIVVHDAALDRMQQGCTFEELTDSSLNPDG